MAVEIPAYTTNLQQFLLKNKAHAHLDQQSELLLVLRWAAIVSRIFPGEIHSIKVMVAKEADG